MKSWFIPSDALAKAPTLTNGDARVRNHDRGHDGYRGELNRACVTIAEALGANGYRTYMSGKWHVTKATNPKTEEDKHNWPLQRGFDQLNDF